MKITRCSGALTLAVAVALGSGTLALADLDQGMGFFKSGKYAEAAAEFQALVDHAPSYDFGYYMLGLSFYKLGKLDEAVGNIGKALELNGDKFEYHHAQASVYHAKRDNRNALSVLNEAEGLVDNNTKFAFYSLRGFILADLDKWGEAVEDLEKARAVKNSSQILNNLGKAYYKLGYYDKAAPILRESARMNPNDANTQLFLAESLVNLGKESDDAAEKKHYAEALQVATKYRNMRPDDYYAANLVGKSALGAQDFKEAEQSFRKVLQLKPDYCYAMVNLSKCYIAQEKWVEAEKISREATECAPRLTAGYESLGYSLQKQGKLEDALKVYRKAYEIKPSDSVKQLMDVVAKNIAIRDENRAMEEEERRLAEEAARAQAEYEKELEKRRQWEKKRDE